MPRKRGYCLVKGCGGKLVPNSHNLLYCDKCKVDHYVDVDDNKKIKIYQIVT